MSPDTSHHGKGTALSTDDTHHLLSNERRRLVVALLEEHESLDKSELAERIAAIETGSAPDSQERKRVYVSLHQCHLPKLTDHGVIEERPAGIKPGPNHSALVPFVDRISKWRRASSFVRNAV